MTTLYSAVRVCGVCSMPNLVTVIASTSYYNMPDLDGRVYVAVPDKCWLCHYANWDIREANGTQRGFVRSALYSRECRRKDMPAPALSCHCLSLLRQHTNELEEAGGAALTAAWICDDIKHYAGSYYHRERALRLLIAAPKQEMSSDDHGFRLVQLADINRRMERFEAASDWLKQIESPDEMFQIIIYFQRRLIYAKDTRRHSLREIEKLLQPCLKQRRDAEIERLRAAQPSSGG